MISRKKAIEQYVKATEGARVLRAPVLTKGMNENEKPTRSDNAICTFNRLLLVSSRRNPVRYS